MRLWSVFLVTGATAVKPPQECCFGVQIWMTYDFLVLQALLVKLQTESNEVPRVVRISRIAEAPKHRFHQQAAINSWPSRWTTSTIRMRAFLFCTGSELRLSQGPPRPFWVPSSRIAS